MDFSKSHNSHDSLTCFRVVSVCDKVTSSTGSKPAKGTPFASWLQQSNQQKAYLRKYKNYFQETQCVHSYTGLIMKIKYQE
jgi:hypothetical protein